MKYDYIFALDPSGSYEEGKGTTGLCLYNCNESRIVFADVLKATKFQCKESYWMEHANYLLFIKNHHTNVMVVIEEYMLDPNRAMQQSYSRMETSKLIGLLQTQSFVNQIPYTMQRPAEVKQRWKDSILVHKGLIHQVKRHYYLPGSSIILSEHARDAIRHAVHFATFKNKED